MITPTRSGRPLGHGRPGHSISGVRPSSLCLAHTTKGDRKMAEQRAFRECGVGGRWGWWRPATRSSKRASGIVWTQMIRWLVFTAIDAQCTFRKYRYLGHRWRGEGWGWRLVVVNVPENAGGYCSRAGKLSHRRQAPSALGMMINWLRRVIQLSALFR